MPPRVISHYRVIRRLGIGGMGEVFLAQDTKLERPVTLKVMSAELARDPNQRKRYRTEAKAVSGSSDPHKYHPLWKDLRPHPRAHAILKKMNLVK